MEVPDNNRLQRTVIRHRERGVAILRSRRAYYVSVPPLNGTLNGIPYVLRFCIR